MTAVAVLIAAAFPVWQSFTEYGWLGVVFGNFATAFWLAVLIWVGCVAGAIICARRWWVLLTAPIVLFPVFMSGLLVVATASRAARPRQRNAHERCARRLPGFADPDQFCRIVIETTNITAARTYIGVTPG
jgi:hypothetical protein